MQTEGKTRTAWVEFSSRSLPHEDINNYLKSFLGDAVLREACTTLGSFSFWFRDDSNILNSDDSCLGLKFVFHEFVHFFPLNCTKNGFLIGFNSCPINWMRIDCCSPVWLRVIQDCALSQMSAWVKAGHFLSSVTTDKALKTVRIFI